MIVFADIKLCCYTLIDVVYTSRGYAHRANDESALPQFALKAFMVSMVRQQPLPYDSFSNYPRAYTVCSGASVGPPAGILGGPGMIRRL